MVWYTARRLHQALAGRVLVCSDFRVPRLATVDLSGDVVTEAVSRGKHLLVRTGNGMTVHTHLRMDGSWRVRPAAERVRESHRIRLMLANDDWRAIGYQLGVVELLPTAQEQRATGHLGPDLLGADWDCAEAVRRLTAEPDRAIGEALLDQRNLAGIGNLYKAEMLFLRAVDPWRTGRQRAGPGCPCGTRAATARREQDANRPGDDRRHGTGAADLGVRASVPAMPTVRDHDQEGRAGRRRRGAAQVLVSGMPEIAAVSVPGSRLAAERRTIKLPSGVPPAIISNC